MLLGRLLGIPFSIDHRRQIITYSGVAQRRRLCITCLPVHRYIQTSDGAAVGVWQRFVRNWGTERLSLVALQCWNAN
jgi:hypothetical protein